ncbi:MAG TPA: restriction endonuclease [Candidatus Sulfotelmatobacter sp.]
MIPSFEELELPLLRVLEANGGRARPVEVYEKIKQYFPSLTEAELAETVASGDNRFRNRVRWARQILIDKGDVYRADYGVWGITDRGRSRLTGKATGQPYTRNHGITPAAPADSSIAKKMLVQEPQTAVTNLEELSEDYSAVFERKVLQELLDRKPEEFEQFAVKLLSAYGFRKMKVTHEHTAPDGGIDGNGELKVGLVNMRAAFQCKRWQGQVGRPEVDKFRGAIQGQYEHGYFFTTSRFSVDARQASIKSGAVPIFLFDGHEIVEIMIDKGLGITRKPIEIYVDRIDSLFEAE